MGRSDAKKPQGELDFLTQKAYLVLGGDNQDSQPQSVIAELVLPSKETTSHAKSPTYTPSSQERKSSKISGRDSTTKGKDLKPYWSELCAEISSQLLLPVETDLPDLGLNSLSTWLEVTVRVVQPL
ncbi:hypothetical protein BJP34_28400 [Moorena producens PAL-8-15-08-1]|uniref:Uncharacterized protein n=1 Tax=Moorena producens PAL-8-15-08-1 TaxID=1458985 RepID=A0A1D8TYW0_9CYAN|nr:hypothetical protein BJP34_28400 [Moorena producens PAL-8-15-08-1]